MKAKLTLADLAPLPTAEMPIVHPLHGDMGVSITVQGAHTKEVKHASLKVAITAAAVKGETDHPKLLAAFETIGEQTLEIALQAVVGWSDDKFFGGAFSKELAATILKTDGMKWLVDDIVSFIGKQSNFFRPATK